MPVTKLFFCLVAVAGIAIFLATLPRLTFEEKKRAFFLAVGAFPVMGLACYLIADSMHHEAYQAGAQALPEGDANGLFALSFVVGLAASGALLWAAGYLNGQRTYEGFLEAQREEVRAIERAKIAAEERQQRMIEGRTQLAAIEMQRDLVAIERGRAKLQADEERVALQQSEQAFLLAYQRYCSRVDPLKQKDENTLVDGFRDELGRRAIGRLDVKQLDQSGNALVQRVLNGRPTIKLTP